MAGSALEIALMYYAIDGLPLLLLTPSIGTDATTDEVIDPLVTRLLAPTAATSHDGDPS